MINRFLFDTGLFFMVAVAASALFTRFALDVLRRRAILDLPNVRSSHTTPTPRGGGWGVMLALLPLWIWATARAGRLGDPAEWLIVAGVAMLMAISWVDDRRGLGAGTRILAQIIAVGAVMAFLPRDLTITGGFFPLPLDRLVAMVVWLWFINLFNFMDGIDGLTGGSAAAMGIGIMLVSLRYGPSQLEAFRGAMIAAVSIGFLFWNWHPARIFLGDIGSIPIGYLLGYELLHLAMNGGQILALIIPLYYLSDATITLVRRALRRERIWQAHREHFYQRSVHLHGRSHAQTAKTAILVQFALSIFAILAAIWGWWLLIVSIGLVALLLRWMNKPPASRTRQ
jgi:UDP-N-acetylmuramyl pentapeptide phosphotransferase/UDP-N-acetylglucosamine-1-phosphate transferase